ncbi:MAG: phosphatidylglycerophosphatase A [Balneolaceae bacterium]
MTRLKIGFGTFFGTGLLPKAPGTWGSFVSLPFIFAASFCFPEYGIFVFIFAACLLSVWSAPAAVEKYGPDPPQFVMDECAGQAVVFLLSGFYTISLTEFYTLAAGFILFRVFDILKPLGIDYIQKLPGKFGILADDLLAGFYALVCLELLKRIPAFL